MNELVRYHNDFNNIILTNFTERELDLLMAICFKLKNQSSNELNLTFEELKELIKYEDRNIGKFIKLLDNAYSKLLNARIRFEDETQIDNILLFTRYKVSKLEKTVLIKVNEEFKYLLNELTSNYTKFELEHFTSIKSHYGKLMFKLLKQFDSTGKREFKIEDFRELLDIPASYRISEINSKVLTKKNIEELEKVFKNLKIEKIKNRNERNVSRIVFTWDKIKNVQNNQSKIPLKQQEKKPIQIAEEPEKTVEELYKLAISRILMKNKNKVNPLQELAKLNTFEEIEKFIEKNDLNLEEIKIFMEK
jgi:plasmid replication initiation protein